MSLWWNNHPFLDDCILKFPSIIGCFLSSICEWFYKWWNNDFIWKISSILESGTYLLYDGKAIKIDTVSSPSPSQLSVKAQWEWATQNKARPARWPTSLFDTFNSTDKHLNTLVTVRKHKRGQASQRASEAKICHFFTSWQHWYM
jgi:hypothetical protein